MHNVPFHLRAFTDGRELKRQTNRKKEHGCLSYDRYLTWLPALLSEASFSNLSSNEGIIKNQSDFIFILSERSIPLKTQKTIIYSFLTTFIFKISLQFLIITEERAKVLVFMMSNEIACFSSAMHVNRF